MEMARGRTTSVESVGEAGGEPATAGFFDDSTSESRGRVYDLFGLSGFIAWTGCYIEDRPASKGTD